MATNNPSITKKTTVEAGGCVFTLVPAKATTKAGDWTNTSTITAVATKRADDSWLVLDRSGNVIGFLRGEDDDWNAQSIKSRNLNSYEVSKRVIGSGDSAVAALAAAFGVNQSAEVV